MMSETFGPPRWSVASHGSPSKPLDLTLMSKEACWCEKGIGVCVCLCVSVCVCVFVRASVCGTSFANSFFSFINALVVSCTAVEY